MALVVFCFSEGDSDRLLLVVGLVGDEPPLEESDELEPLPLLYSFSAGPCSG